MPDGDRKILIGRGVAAAAIGCATAGTASLLDASDTWQGVLNTARAAESQRVGPCPGQFTVSGFGDFAVLLLAAVLLGLLALAAFGIGRGRQWEKRAQYSAVGALLVTLALWLDTIIVAASSIGDCDGSGLAGGASIAINRSGFLWFATMLLSMAMAVWLETRNGEDYLSGERYVGSSL